MREKEEENSTNTVYTHVNRKMIHVGTIPRMGEEGNKGE
jgi:hypothetical protein